MARYDSGVRFDSGIRFDEPDPPPSPAPRTINQNRISVVMTTEQKTGASDAMGDLDTSLPFLIGLSKDDRKRLPKVGDGPLPFIQKALLYAQQNPGVLPGNST